jgi:ankyrin repeat protein
MTSESESRESELLIAVARGDRATLGKLLQAGGDANARDRWGVPALAVAAGRGDLECLRLLLDHGADPNLGSNVGNRPVMIAAARGRLEAARDLLAAGADPTAGNDWGLKATDWAEWAREPAEMRALLDERGRRT